MSFPARFPGRCPACDSGIAVDSQVAYNDEDEVIHEECLIVPQAAVKHGWVCSRCFVEMSLSATVCENCL